MKKIFLTICIMFCFICNSYSQNVTDNIEIPIRDYDGIELAQGTFIPVMNAQEISTQYCPEGFKVKFISTNDLFLYEENIIPKGTAFYGYIEKINEPVIGTHSSMSIKINKMVFADNYENPIKGYIYTTNNNIIGGGLTEPAEYIKVPHYQQKFQGRFWDHRGATLQIRPGATRKMGEHTKINSGEELLIILTSPAWITHTLTN